MAAPRIAVLGGGLSGLSLAHFLRQAVGPAASVTVLEAADTLGGLVDTVRFPSRQSGRSYLFERGCRGISKSPHSLYVFQLIQDLHMEDEVLVIPPHGSKRYIHDSEGSMLPIPTSPLAGLRSPLVSGATRALIRDRFFSQPSKEEDETVFDFFQSRFGDTIVEKLVDPVITGTYGGDLRSMSMAATFPLWYPLMKEQGSVMLALRMGNMRAFEEAAKDVLPSEFIRMGMASPGLSFLNGTETLVDRLADSLRATDNTHVLTGARVQHVAPTPEGDVRVRVENAESAEQASHNFTHVFSTLPADDLSRVLPAHCTAAKEALDEISFSSFWVVNLGYSEPQVMFDGVGYSVPTGVESPVMRAVFDSNVFPQQAAGPDTRVSVTLGREYASGLEGRSMEEVANLAADSLAYHLQNPELATPDAADAVWVPRAYPMSPVGHDARMATIRADVEAGVPGLQALAFDGLDVSFCVAAAYKAAKELGRQLRLSDTMRAAAVTDSEPREAGEGAGGGAAGTAGAPPGDGATGTPTDSDAAAPESTATSASDADPHNSGSSKQ